jgi:hypothetical protein
MSHSRNVIAPLVREDRRTDYPAEGAIHFVQKKSRRILAAGKECTRLHGEE